MRPLHVFILFLFGAFTFTACEKTSIDIFDHPTVQIDDYSIPEIPEDIAELMTEEEILKFKAGPGADYSEAIQVRRRHHHGRWHPVLMRMTYHLQIGPIGGTACEPGQFQPCFGPGAPPDPTDCLASVVGAAGQTIADGHWFHRPIHAEYYPVFCLPDYAGFGSGFYSSNGSLLWIEATNTAFQYDDEFNSVFYRFANYIPQQSTGIFEGAFGWEIARMYTAVENSPSNDPNGQGESDVIIFGWVYF